MKRYLPIVAVLSILLSSTPTLCNNPEEDLQEIVTINNLMGMSVIAVHDSKIAYEGYFGLSNYSENIPVAERTLYRVASISKTVSSMAFMMLHEQGLADLDDDISDILGYTIRNPHHPDIPITPRMLMSHTSTLNDGSTYAGFLGITYNNPSPPAISELILHGGNNYAADIWINATPGEHFRYCNLGYGLLGSVIEAITQTRFDQFVYQNILSPLEIDGGFNIHELNNPSNLAVLYRMDCGQWSPQFDHFPQGLPEPVDYSDYIPGHNGLIFAPQGGLRISAKDLSKIMILLMNKGTYEGMQLLSESTVELMLEQQWQYDGNNGNNYGNLFNAWGLGLHLITNQQDGDIVIPGYSMKGHSGQAYGLISDMYFNNDPDFGIIFITNGSAGPFFEGLKSAFYEVEEQIFAALYQHFIAPQLAVQHLVTIVTEGMGTTQPAPGTYTLTEGEVLELTAQPSQGWKFEHYILDGEIIPHPSVEIPIEAPVTITAVFAEISTTTGHNSLYPQNGFFINHQTNTLTINWTPEQLKGPSRLEIFNLKGVQLFSGPVFSNGQQLHKKLDVSFLPGGAYIAVVRNSNKELKIGRFIKP